MGHNAGEPVLTRAMTETRFVSPDFSSAEAQRQWYLRLLGVNSYFPRFVLPGALPSQPCELPAPESMAPAAAREATPPAPDIPASQPASKPSVSEAGKAGTLRRVLLEEDAAPTRPAAVPGPSAASESRGESPAAGVAPRFRMLLLRTERGLAVCNQVPLQGPEALQAQEQRLLQNILAWLGTGLGAGRPRAFLWPPLGLGADGADAEALAARSLFGFLEQAQQEQGFTRLLLMGSTAPDLLQRWQDAEGRALPWQAFRSHSLGEMLAQPLLKRETWQSLQALHRLLQSG